MLNTTPAHVQQLMNLLSVVCLSVWNAPSKPLP